MIGGFQFRGPTRTGPSRLLIDSRIGPSTSISSVARGDPSQPFLGTGNEAKIRSAESETSFFAY